MRTIQNQKKMEKDQMNKQVGGTHYEVLTIQPVELFGKYNLNWFQAEPIKYVSRYRNKNGLQDLKKAYHILGMSQITTPLGISTKFSYDSKKLNSFSSYLYIEYIDQFNDNYFINGRVSRELFKDIIIAILNKDYILARRKVGLLIYAEYEEKIN